MTKAPDAKPWPPLIVADRVPWPVKWRDALITCLAWAGFGYLLSKELASVFGALHALALGDADARSDGWAHLGRMTPLDQLAPFLLIAAALAAVLVGFGLLTLQRRSRSLRLPQPQPLDAAVQASAAGLDEAALVAARDQRILVVQFGDNVLRIEARHEPLPDANPPTAGAVG